MLAEERLPVTAVVEPHEAEVYGRVHLVDIRSLPERGRGITFARGQVLELARREGHPWFWMIDDDVSAFLRFEGTKGRRVTAREALLAAQEAARGGGVGQVSLEYQQFAWSAGGRVAVNSYCDVCVGIRSDVGASYRGPDLKEDRDYTMQVIGRGLDTRRVTEYAFAAPSVGSNRGGLYEEYREGKDAVAARRLAERWPWCVEVVQKRTRVDAKIHWRRIRPGFATLKAVGSTA
jgi:hypothetical protein